MEFMTGEWFGRLLEVLVVNLILSGDNAVVIAMAARTLEGANRRRAIVLGAAGAVVLRLVFAGIITLLLEVPLLQVAGGLLLVWIAWGLIHDDEGDPEDKVKAGQSIWHAVRIIIVADAVMSLDNVIALVQAARIGLLVYLAVEMLFQDKVLHPYLEHYESIEWIVGLAAAGIFMAIAWLWAQRSNPTKAG
jgi:YjbE family integral membrane protein